MIFFNIVGYQVCWFLLIFCSTLSIQYFVTSIISTILFILIHFYFTPQKKADLLMMLYAGISGLVIDGLFILFNFYKFPTQIINFTFPIWLLLIWLIFGLCLNHSLKFLKKSFLLSSIVGGIFAPMAYYSGYTLGAIFFPNLFITLLLISIVWMMILPCLVFLSK